MQLLFVYYKWQNLKIPVRKVKKILDKKGTQAEHSKLLKKSKAKIVEMKNVFNMMLIVQTIGKKKLNNLNQNNVVKKTAKGIKKLV